MSSRYARSKDFSDLADRLDRDIASGVVLSGLDPRTIRSMLCDLERAEHEVAAPSAHNSWCREGIRLTELDLARVLYKIDSRKERRERARRRFLRRRNLPFAMASIVAKKRRHGGYKMLHGFIKVDS
jgi:hypothetical protein